MSEQTRERLEWLTGRRMIAVIVALFIGWALFVALNWYFDTTFWHDLSHWVQQKIKFQVL